MSEIIPVYGSGSILIHASIVEDEETATKTLCGIDSLEPHDDELLSTDDVQCLQCLAALRPRE